MAQSIEKDYVLRTSDFSPAKIIRAASVLDLFQDVAGYHSDTLGCGLKDFQAKNLGWVLVGVRYELIKDFQMYSSVKVKTWPLQPSFAKFQREYLVTGDDGVMLKGTSIWTVIDLNTRKIVPIKNVYEGIDDYIAEKNFAEKFTKISSPDSQKFVLGGKRTVLRTDLDMNRHVNNIRYMNFVVDVFGEQMETYKNVHIDYNKELTFGQTVYLYRAEEDSVVYIKGFADDELIFTAQYKN